MIKKWNKCSDMMPANEDMVLVTCVTKNGYRSVNRAYFDGKSWHGSGSMAGVVAWMPLPEPYKDEES